MSYLAQSKLTEDSFLVARVAACAARAGVPGDARVWAASHIWQLSAVPGWAAAYAEALDEDPPTDPAAWAGVPGARGEVITDEMILEAVSALLGPPTSTEEA